MFKKIVALVVFLTMVIIPFAYVNEAKAAPAKGNVLYVGQISDPIVFCPFNANETGSSYINNQLFRGLLKVGLDKKIYPDLAAEMPKYSKDFKTVTFKLKKNVKWDDGVPFTSADVKFSIEYQTDPEAGAIRQASFGEIVESVEAPDPYTVVFHLKYVSNITESTFTNNYIVPKHLWEKVPKKDNMTAKNPYNQKPVGCGPFKFVEFIPNERTVLERNPLYDGPMPKIDKIIVKNIGSTAAQMIQLQTQEIDYAAIQPGDLPTMRTQKHLNIYTYNTLTYDYLTMNQKLVFFKDKRVRQAIAYAVNKMAIINGVYRGIGTPAIGPYIKGCDGYSENVKKYNYDINQAKKLLDAAGWKVGSDGIREKDGKKFEVTLMTNKGNALREKAIVLIQSQLKLVGVKVDVRVTDFNTYITKYMMPRKFEMAYGGIQASDTTADTRYLFHSNPDLGTFNYASYNNPEIDKLTEQAVAEMDPKKAAKLHEKIAQITTEDMPILFILYGRTNLGVNKRISNVKYADLMGINLQYEHFATWTLTQ